MPKRIPQTDLNAKLVFGGGVHSRGSEADIDPRECADGENFVLDVQNAEMRNRKPYDLLGTTPNAAEIRGFATLKDDAGTVTLLVQAGGTVYSWNGTTFTSVGSVSSSAKLRGRKEHYWPLNDLVIITDLNLQQPVMTWDGATLSTMAHNLTGTFMAKYCHVANERANYANVVSNGTATPHMLVGSALGDHDNLSVSSRPSSGATSADPWFLLTLDLRSINGLVGAFGLLALSSEDGRIFKLTGSDKTDFAIEEFYDNSAASGNEALAFIGTDVLYGRVGRIESLIQSDKFGDVEKDDLSLVIANSIAGYKNWTLVYNHRTELVYCFAESQSDLWVLNKNLLLSSDERLLGALGKGASGISPWSKYTTQHSLSFQPTAVMNALDPVDGLEYVFFGDGAGNLYKMEGSGASGDAGVAPIKTRRKSGLMSAPQDAKLYDIEGYVRHRIAAAQTLTLRFLFAGEEVYSTNITVDLPADTGGSYFGGSFYFNDAAYFSSPFEGRLSRERFDIGGFANEFQIETEIESNADFQISEIGIQFTASA